MSQRPVLTPEERALPYAKYYDLPFAPVPAEKIAVLEGGPMDPGDALPLADRAKLLESGYFPVEIGYCVMPDGTAYVSNLTQMPGVTPEMFEWWFAWHALEDTRYRIWDPEDHFYARQQMPEKGRDPKASLREKIWGTVHHVYEDIGLGPEEILINWRYPHELGYDESKLGTKDCGAMVCANIHGIVPGEGLTAIMTHMVREIEGGVELRSRFWLGCGWVGGQVVKLLPEGSSIPMEAARGLFAHNLKEFGQLASILPSVYAENKDNW